MHHAGAALGRVLLKDLAERRTLLRGRRLHAAQRHASAGSHDAIQSTKDTTASSTIEIAKPNATTTTTPITMSRQVIGGPPPCRPRTARRAPPARGRRTRPAAPAPRRGSGRAAGPPTGCRRPTYRPAGPWPPQLHPPRRR